MAEKKVEAGEVIFNEGDTADVAYVVTSGAVELLYTSSGSEVRAGMALAGKVFGEIALFNPEELRPYMARATEKSVLQSMDEKEFHAQLAKAPKEVQPFFSLIFEKLAPVKSKSKTAPVMTVAKGDITKIVIAPATDALKSQFKPMEISVGILPFRIGGHGEGEERSRRDQANLVITSSVNPLRISRQHCEITLDEHENLIINDLGSRFCTVVNGKMIGRGRGAYTAPLKKGDNEIGLSAEPAYRLSVKCS